MLCVYLYCPLVALGSNILTTSNTLAQYRQGHRALTMIQYFITTTVPMGRYRLRVAVEYLSSSAANRVKRKHQNKKTGMFVVF